MHLSPVLLAVAVQRSGEIAVRVVICTNDTSVWSPLGLDDGESASAPFAHTS